MQSSELRIGSPVSIDRGEGYANRFRYGAAVSAPMIISGTLFVLCLWEGHSTHASWERVAELRHLTVVEGLFT